MKAWVLFTALAFAGAAAHGQTIEERIQWWKDHFPEYVPDNRPASTLTPSDSDPSYAQNCARRTNGRSSHVQGKSWSYGRYSWRGIEYWLTSYGSYIALTATLKVNTPEGTYSEQDDLYRRLDDTKTCMRQFFWRHGINLDLRFTRDDRGLDGSNYVTLRSNGVRGPSFNMHDWAFSLDGYTLRSPCSTFVHEFGHMFGLPDEYPESGLTVREYDSVMRSAHSQPHELRFYPRHLQIMLAPLCG